MTFFLNQIFQKSHKKGKQITNGGSTNHFRDRINLTKRSSTLKALCKYYLLLTNGTKKTSELCLDAQGRNAHTFKSGIDSQKSYRTPELVTVSHNHSQQNSPAAKASTIYAVSFEIQTLVSFEYNHVSISLLRKDQK